METRKTEETPAPQAQPPAPGDPQTDPAVPPAEAPRTKKRPTWLRDFILGGLIPLALLPLLMWLVLPMYWGSVPEYSHKFPILVLNFDHHNLIGQGILDGLTPPSLAEPSPSRLELINHTIIAASNGSYFAGTNRTRWPKEPAHVRFFGRSANLVDLPDNATIYHPITSPLYPSRTHVVKVTHNETIYQRRPEDMLDLIAAKLYQDRKGGVTPDPDHSLKSDRFPYLIRSGDRLWAEFYGPANQSDPPTLYREWYEELVNPPWLLSVLSFLYKGPFWGVVVVAPNATATLELATRLGDKSYDPTSAVYFYYNTKFRDPGITERLLVPEVTAAINSVLADINKNITRNWLKQQAANFLPALPPLPQTPAPAASPAAPAPRPSGYPPILQKREQSGEVESFSDIHVTGLDLDTVLSELDETFEAAKELVTGPGRKNLTTLSPMSCASGHCTFNFNEGKSESDKRATVEFLAGESDKSESSDSSDSDTETATSSGTIKPTLSSRAVRWPDLLQNSAATYSLQRRSAVDVEHAVNMALRCPQCLGSPLILKTENLAKPATGDDAVRGHLEDGLIYLFLFSLATAVILHNAIIHMSQHKRRVKTLIAWLVMSLLVYSFGSLMYTLVIKAFGHHFPRDHKLGKKNFGAFWLANFGTMVAFGTVMDAIFALLGINWGMLVVLLWFTANFAGLVRPRPILNPSKWYGIHRKLPAWDNRLLSKRLLWRSYGGSGSIWASLSAWALMGLAIVPLCYFARTLLQRRGRSA